MTTPTTRLRYRIQYDFEDVTITIASPIFDSILDHVVVDELVIDFEEMLEGDKLVNLNDRIKEFLREWGIFGSNGHLMLMKLRDDANLIRVGDNT